jgi:hypothetical protein
MGAGGLTGIVKVGGMNELDLCLRYAVCLVVLGLFSAGVGCSSSSENGAGGGGMGGQGSGGDAGVGGAGGTGGAIDASAIELCEAWCRNEPRGPSCCVEDPFFGGNCREGCYDQCEQMVADLVCLEEWTAARRCELGLACDDFFDECQSMDDRFMTCSLRASAEATGACATAASACAITEAECLETYQTGSAACGFRWDQYVGCAGDGFTTCQECVTFSRPSEEECDWPSGAADGVPFVPQTCDSFALPPVGCGESCPGGTDPECGFGTYCDETICEANCIVNTDCARGDACSVRGRCLPTVFGSPLQCSFFEDPPSGCGESCSSGTDCPQGTFCNFTACDAECVSSDACNTGQECSETGICQNVPFDECSADRSVDPSFERDRRALSCNVMGIGIALEAELTASPTAALQLGMNTYDIQPVVSLPVPTVNLLLALTDTLTVLDADVIIRPSLGSSSPNAFVATTNPLPCDFSLQNGEPSNIVFPVQQSSWDLDDGTTQELTLEELEVTIFAAGLEITLATTQDANCAWDGAPPSVSFNVP